MSFFDTQNIDIKECHCCEDSKDVQSMNRQNIAMKVCCCEDSKDFPKHEVQEGKENFHLLIQEYQAKDVHNRKAIRLFYCALQTKFFTKNGSECH